MVMRVDHAHGLVLAGEFTPAKGVCEEVIAGIDEKIPFESTAVFFIHLHLSLILNELGVEPEKKQESVIFLGRVSIVASFPLTSPTQAHRMGNQLSPEESPADSTIRLGTFYDTPCVREIPPGSRCSGGATVV